MHRWTKAGIVVAALAGLLAAFGLYFAVSQTRALGVLRIADARNEAVQLRTATITNIKLHATRLLVRASEHHRANESDHAFPAARPVTWLRDLFLWDGHSLRHWPDDTTDDDPPISDELLELLAEKLRNRLDGLAPVRHFTTDFLFVTAAGRSLSLACRIFSTANVGHATAPPQGVAAVRIDISRLKTDFLDQDFPTYPSVKVVVGQTPLSRYWSEPLAAALQPLFIEPSPDFVASQRQSVRLQIGLFAAVTAVFVLALLATIRKFVLLVDREVALSHLKSNFVADVSHELKTPLALIRMFGEMLLEDRVPTEEKKREYYGIITRETVRLTQLIENILDFSRIDAGRKEYTLQQVDIGLLVRETYQNYRLDLDHHGFEHELRIAPNLPLVDADADAIAQAILNLISNSVKYSRDEKRLAIDVSCETRRGRHGVLISVRDNGIGIKPEDRARLFDGFFRSTHADVRRVRGAGLGLALVKHIVDAHDGSIDVESRLVKGSTFRIFLPESGTNADTRASGGPTDRRAEPGKEPTRGKNPHR